MKKSSQESLVKSIINRQEAIKDLLDTLDKFVNEQTQIVKAANEEIPGVSDYEKFIRLRSDDLCLSLGQLFYTQEKLEQLCEYLGLET